MDVVVDVSHLHQPLAVPYKDPACTAAEQQHAPALRRGRLGVIHGGGEVHCRRFVHHAKLSRRGPRAHRYKLPIRTPWGLLRSTITSQKDIWEFPASTTMPCPTKANTGRSSNRLRPRPCGFSAVSVWS